MHAVLWRCAPFCGVAREVGGCGSGWAGREREGVELELLVFFEETRKFVKKPLRSHVFRTAFAVRT